MSAKKTQVYRGNHALWGFQQSPSSFKGGFFYCIEKDWLGNYQYFNRLSKTKQHLLSNLGNVMQIIFKAFICGFFYFEWTSLQGSSKTLWSISEAEGKKRAYWSAKKNWKRCSFSSCDSSKLPYFFVIQHVFWHYIWGYYMEKGILISDVYIYKP